MSKIKLEEYLNPFIEEIRRFKEDLKLADKNNEILQQRITVLEQTRKLQDRQIENLKKQLINTTHEYNQLKVQQLNNQPIAEVQKEFYVPIQEEV